MCVCVCFTKYSFVSLVTPEDHTNTLSTSSPLNIFVNENVFSQSPFSKRSPALINILLKSCSSVPSFWSPHTNRHKHGHTGLIKHTHALVHPVPNMHLWSHKVRYAPEGVYGKEIHYFSFCLPLLCAAQQLKGSDQPTITIHNGFSASSTSLEACLRSGLSPCAPPPPRTHPLCIALAPASATPHVCVCV